MQKLSTFIIILLFGGLVVLGMVSRQNITELPMNGELSTEELVKVLEKKLPGVEISSIEKSPIEGFYQVFFDGQLIYLSKNGQYVFTGNLLELTMGSPVNLSQAAKDNEDAKMAPLRAELINDVNESDMVIYRAKDEKHVITVFTDIDCGYCRKLHKEMSLYNEQGITIRYMAYPRSGVNSDSYNKLVSVWCADDRQSAMDNAKLNRQFTPRSCKNPVAQQFKLTRKFNLTGTPSLILSDGELIGGYVPVAKLLAHLNQKEAVPGKVNTDQSAPGK